MRSAHAALYVHLVWATWERQPFLQEDIKRQMYRLIGAKCQELHAQIIAIGGIEDHVHVLVGVPPMLSVADLVKHLKGASSRIMNKQLETSPTHFFKWQDGYGAISVSPSALNEVARYIAQQKEHHAAGSLIAPWEPLDEPRSADE
jgi:REP element-mobilizing transposase RayT